MGFHIHSRSLGLLGSDLAWLLLGSREVRAMSDSTERYYAAMESARNTASEEYFTARPQLDRTIEQKTLFNAGFERAYKPLYEALSSIQWMRDCGIDEPDPENPGFYRNCAEQERNGMYNIATNAIGTSREEAFRSASQAAKACVEK